MIRRAFGRTRSRSRVNFPQVSIAAPISGRASGILRKLRLATLCRMRRIRRVCLKPLVKRLVDVTGIEPNYVVPLSVAKKKRGKRDFPLHSTRKQLERGQTGQPSLHVIKAAQAPPNRRRFYLSARAAGCPSDESKLIRMSASAVVGLTKVIFVARPAPSQIAGKSEPPATSLAFPST
jgi:hypothetical protein